MTAFTRYQPLNNLSYSGFGKRFVAYLIDNVLIYIALLAVQFLVSDMTSGDIPLENESITGETNETNFKGLIFAVLGPWIYYARLESG